MAKISAHGASALCKLRIHIGDPVDPTPITYAFRSDGQLLRKVGQGSYAIAAPWSGAQPQQSDVYQRLVQRGAVQISR